MAEKYHILYVDDEQDNLIAFKAVFRRYYKIYLALNGEEALKTLKEDSIDLVISDQRMPKMTGVELLEKVRNLHPDVIRMVLTGYSDVQAIIDAINKGQVYHYITKPWDVDELRVIMNNALETAKLKQQNRALEQERNELLLQKTQMEKENILSQFEILKNQINPHFLFNSMNVLASLIPKAPVKAVDFTTRFAHLYRKILQLREQLIIPLSQELEFIQAYLFLQKMRFDESLQVSIEIEEQHKQSCVPPFALQILVENAIKHNIVSESLPLQIKIFTKDQHLKVINNLQARGNKPDSTKIGLSNLRARYQMITDAPISFEAKDGEYVATLPLVLEG